MAGPGLALNGAIIPNHSVLMKSQSVIGTDDDALYCVTDDVTCCGTLPSPGDGGSGNGRGSWYFPFRHLEAVPSSTGHDGFWYASWLTGAVLLNYRGDGSAGHGVTGLFHCEIRDNDSGNTLHRFYTCIYDTDNGQTDCKYPALTHILTILILLKLSKQHVIVCLICGLL